MHNLLNQKFERLLVIEKAPYNKNRQDMWRCKCDCGNEKIIMGAHLRRGVSKSCGCLTDEIISLDLTGMRSGKLIAIEKSHNLKHKRQGWVWKCKCDCGNYAYVRAPLFKAGHTRSCGCLLTEANIKKRKYKTREESSYRSIYSRYKKNALIQKLSFDISFDYFVETINKPCFYCEQAPNRQFAVNGGDLVFVNGVDRVNNLLGYIENNCIPCCKSCNIIKSNLDLPELQEYAETLSKIISKLKSLE